MLRPIAIDLDDEEGGSSGQAEGAAPARETWSQLFQRHVVDPDADSLPPSQHGSQLSVDQ